MYIKYEFVTHTHTRDSHLDEVKQTHRQQNHIAITQTNKAITQESSTVIINYKSKQYGVARTLCTHTNINQDAWQISVPRPSKSHNQNIILNPTPKETNLEEDQSSLQPNHE